MNRVHIEGEVLDFQVGLGREAVQVVVVERLHQLCYGEVGSQVEVGAAIEFEVFGQEALQIRHRHITFHLEFQADVAQQIIHQSTGSQAAAVEFSIQAVDGHAVGSTVQIQVQICIQVDIRERIRQARYIHLGIVGQDFSRNQGHQTIVVGAFHLRLGDAQFAGIFHTTELFLHTFRQISQHIFDKQSVGIQAQIEVNVVVFSDFSIAIYINKVFIQSDLGLVKMQLQIRQPKLQRQIQIQGILLQIRLVQVQTNVWSSQFQCAFDLIQLCHFAIKIEVQDPQCQLNSLHLQG